MTTRKLGKPGRGYGESRNLTRRESQVTGYPQSVVILHEIGTSMITFWTVAKGSDGLDSYGTYDSNSIARNKLEKFWDKK